jgi:hypothetical protein
VLDRLAAMGPGLTDLHDVKVELGLLQDTVDRLAGLMSETQQSFGSPLRTGVVGRRGGSGGEENGTCQAL